MVRLERFGGGPSRYGLHHRSLDLKESPLIQESADLTDNSGTLQEGLAR